VRPFTGEQPEVLRAAIERGVPARGLRPAEVPTWLQRVVERGLLADPAARWPAMDPLLLALSRDPTRWRRRAALAVLGLAILTLGVLGLLELRARQQAADLAAQRTRTAAAEAEAARARADTDAEQRRGEARRLAAQADLQAGRDPVLRLLLAIEAVAVHTRSGDPPLLAAEQALLDALDSARSRPFLRPGAAVINAVAESPDGRWLATGERDGAVTLWATADPRRPIPLRPADGQPIHSLAFSPDPARLAALVGPGALVWTLPGAITTPVPADRTIATHTPVSKDISHVPEDIIEQPVRWDSPVLDLRDLEWSPDGRALLARAGDLAVVLRPDVAPQLLRGHTGPVRRAVWSPDGAQLLTASADGSARLWPVRGGSPRILRLPAGDPARRGLWTAEFSPDGREVALASADHSAAIVPLRGGPPLRLRGHTGEVYAASFSADGSQLITVSTDETARVWERDGSSAVTPLPGHAELLGGVRIGPDRNLLLGTPAGGPVWVWQLDSARAATGPARPPRQRRQRPLQRRRPTGPQRLGRRQRPPLAARRRPRPAARPRRRPRARQLLPRRPHDRHRQHGRHRAPLAALPSPADRAPRSSRGQLDRRRLQPRRRILRHRRRRRPRPPLVPGQRAAQLLATLPAEAERGAPLLELQWSPNRDRLALAADDGRVHLVGIAQDGVPNTTHVLTGHTGPVRALAFAPDGAHLATAGDDGLVRLWFQPSLAEDTPPPVLSDTLTGHTGPVRSLAFTADSRQLLSAGDDATARVWSLPDPSAPLVLRGHQGPIWQVRPFPQQRAILTASADGTARIWPADGGSPMLLLGHADAVWVATPSPDGLAILTTSSDGTARLWRRDGDGYQALLLPQHGAPGGADHTLWLGSFSPDGRLALTAGADGLARVMPVELPVQLAEACAPRRPQPRARRLGPAHRRARVPAQLPRPAGRLSVAAPPRASAPAQLRGHPTDRPEGGRYFTRRNDSKQAHRHPRAPPVGHPGRAAVARRPRDPRRRAARPRRRAAGPRTEQPGHTCPFGQQHRSLGTGHCDQSLGTGHCDRSLGTGHSDRHRADPLPGPPRPRVGPPLHARAQHLRARRLRRRPVPGRELARALRPLQAARRPARRQRVLAPLPDRRPRPRPALRLLPAALPRRRARGRRHATRIVEDGRPGARATLFSASAPTSSPSSRSGASPPSSCSAAAASAPPARSATTSTP
jgi:WD40 repeat protein